MKKTFFIDFDGTITKEDTCCAMVNAFAKDGWQQINDMWEKKELSTQDCANETFKLFKADMDDVKKLMDTMEIDDYFMEFLELCSQNGWKVFILSDGYDFNIKAILNRYGIKLPYYANKLIYDNGFSIECTYHNPDCGNCGTCKTKLMEQLIEPDNQVIYIGDGYSDLCASEHADLVYGKGILYEKCLAKGINTVGYSHFGEIISHLSSK